MKKLLLALLICLVHLIQLKAYAKEVILATITNDEDASASVLIANVDDTTDRLKSFFKDQFQGKKKIARESLSSAGLKANTGVILEQRKDFIIISLKSTNFDLDQGGTVSIDTLYSGVTNERKSYEVELAKDKTGWRVFAGKKIVSKIHVEVNKRAIVGAIGVKNIHME